MKLFKRRWKKDPHWDGGKWVYEEVDPADLELGYYELVQKMKTQLEKQVKLIGELGWPEEEARNAVQIRVGFKEIKNLESGFDLKKMKTERVQAAAWRKLIDMPTFLETRSLLEECIRDARAELDTSRHVLKNEGNEVREKEEKP